MKKTILFVIFSAPLLLTAQVQHVTIDQALQMGISSSRQLRLDSAKYAQTLVKQSEVNDAALPSLKVNAGYTRLSNITPLSFQFPGDPVPVVLLPNIPNTYMGSVSLQQPLFTGWKLKYAQESYGYLARASQLDAQKDAAEVKLNIISAYITFVKLNLSQQIVSENLKAAQQRVDEVKSLRDRGLATDNDVLKAQLYASNLEVTKTDMDNTVSVAQYTLTILLGLPSGTQIESDTTGLFAVTALLPETNYEQDALNNRIEAQELSLLAKSSQANIKMAQSAYYPTVGLGATYLDARPNQRIFPLQDKFNATWDVGVTVSWNLTSLYTAKHSVSDAQLQYMQNQVQSDQLADNFRVEIFTDYAACQSALLKIPTLTLAVQQAQENSRMVKAHYDQQAALMSDVLDADASLLQARVNLILQKADAKLAWYKLQKASGGLK